MRTRSPSGHLLIGAADRRCTRGTILVIVLWLSLGLVALTLYFGHSVRLHYRAADNHLAAAQAAQAAEAGLTYAMFLAANLETPGQLPEEGTYAAEQVPVGEGAFWFLSHSGETGSTRQRVFALSDEGAKLNLNTATVEMLEGLPGMTAEIAAAIVDWRDEDEEPSENGVESEYYALLDPPYQAKNGPFDSVLELRWVARVTPTLLFGEDVNRNGLLDPNENDGDALWPPDDQDGVLDEGIAEYLTVWSREPNTRSDGSARINVTNLNQNSSQLVSLLQETFGEDRAREIQQRLTGGQAPRSVLEFYLRSGMTADEFAQIEDALTATEGETVQGLVNVNTASEIVLACLPGMDEEKAAQLVAHRQGTNVALDSLAWVTEVLDEETIRQVGPYLTVRSYQLSVDVAGVGRHGRGYCRVRAVIDLTGEEPQIVYRQDLTSLGWALGTDVLSEQAAYREGSQ